MKAFLMIDVQKKYREQLMNRVNELAGKGAYFWALKMPGGLGAEKIYSGAFSKVFSL